MLGFFITPQHDETIYSLFARYGQQVRYPSRISLIKELTGSLNPLNLTLLPSRLGYLEHALPAGHGLSVDTLIDKHTLLPFVGAFWSVERVVNMRTAMRDANSIKTEAAAGLHASHINLPLWLRYCQECMEEDRKQLGFRYWHRAHQLPVIDVCAVHETTLVNSAVPARAQGEWRDLVTAEDGILRLSHRRRAVVHKTSQQILLKLAHDSQWLLKNPCVGIDMAILRDKYLSLLKDRELATWQGRLRRSAIVQDLNAFYTPALLAHLECPLGPPDRTNWAVRLFHARKIASAHTLQHLLIIQWLGYSVSDFVSLCVESKPFGKGPWPCLNSACRYFKHDVIRKCEVRRNTRGRIAGIFSCNGCGFSYLRRGPDREPQSRYRIGQVLNRGAAWENAFIELWNEDGQTLKEMGKRFGISFLTVKRHARRLGLPMFSTCRASCM